MRYLRQLTDVGRGDLALAGGKGANLGELTGAGFPVPPGVVLTTDAYRAYVSTTGIGERILAALADTERPDDPASRIRALFTAAIPDEVAGELLAARKELGPSVAVRSSATAEDLDDASFAGQQDTFLDVRGDDALLAAVRHCWASLWTARAIAYRARRGIDPAEIALAVVVQEMVDADAAGVMFTANATTGVRDEVVIAAAWGLGEAVVGGAVTTDDLVVEKATGRVRSRATAEKAVMTVATGTGTDVDVIPVAALLEEGGQAFVHVVKNGKIERRSVVVGARNAEKGVVVVREGLERGVPVVAVKADGIKAGATAIVKGARAAPPGAPARAS